MLAFSHGAISQLFSFSLVKPLRTIFPKTLVLCHYVGAFVGYKIANRRRIEKILLRLSPVEIVQIPDFFLVLLESGLSFGPSGVWNRIQQSIEINKSRTTGKTGIIRVLWGIVS